MEENSQVLKEEVMHSLRCFFFLCCIFNMLRFFDIIVLSYNHISIIKMWFCWKPKCWMFLNWLAAVLITEVQAMELSWVFWSSKGGVRLPRALCPAREPRPLRHCWGIWGMLTPEVINLATQSLTSAPSSRQTPPGNIKGMAERGGGAFATAGRGVSSTEIGVPLLTRFLTRLFYIILMSLSVWQHRRLKTSCGSSTSWLFLFYCGGKHLLNYRY